MYLSELKTILTSRGVSFKQGTKPDEVSVNCPYCRDTKHRSQVNPSLLRHKITGWCFCYKGWHSYPLTSLFSKLGVSVDSDSQTVTVQTTFEAFEQKMYDLKHPEHQYEPDHSKSVDLSKFTPVMPANSWVAKKALAYLQSRGFTEDQVFEYQLMFDVSGNYTNRVVIPFFEDGEARYFQARDFTGHSPRKIMNPPESEVGVGKTELLFNYDMAKSYNTVIINEGWASAMSSGRNAVAISGKHPSKRQINMLLKTWSDFVVLLDHGAELEAFKLAGALKNARNQVRVALLDSGDPNDHDRQYLQHCIDSAMVIDSVSDAMLLSIQWSKL